MKYSFGPFEADTASKELRKNGVALRLGEQPFQVLAALLEHAGEEIPRDGLQRRIWPQGTYVDFDKGLNSAVNKLRDALADAADRPRYIETIPKRGYRFIARLETVIPEADPGVEAEPAEIPATPKRRGLAIGAVIIGLVLAAAVLAALSRRDPAPVAVRSVLILPFQSVNSTDSDYLGQGISEQVTARLTALPGLRLISPAAAHRVGSAGLSPQEAGQRLNVEAVLFGSVRKSGGKIRVNAQLIRSGDGQVLWAEGGLDVESGDLLEAERLVATAIAARLGRSLTLSERSAVTRRSTSSAEAYELFVRGKLALRNAERNRDGLLIAGQLLEQATKVDPQFAEAWAWLAIAQNRRFGQGFASDQIRKASLANARKALAIDPATIAARSALIRIYHSTGQAEEGLKEASLLRQAGATDSDSLQAMALAYFRAGMPDRSIPLYQQALELDPEDDDLRSDLSFTAYWDRQYELGLRVLEANPSRFHHGRMLNSLGSGRNDTARSAGHEVMRETNAFMFAMCWLYMQEIGDMKVAHEIWRAREAEFRRASTNFQNERVRIGLGIMYAILGDRPKALEQSRLARETNPGDPWTHFWSAEIYGLLGDDRPALENLREAIHRGFLSLHYIDDQFEHPPWGLYRFRNHPEFLAVRKQLADKVQRLRAAY